MKALRSLLFCTALVTLSACTRLSLGIVNLPTRFSDVAAPESVVFAPETNLALDIYVPPQAQYGRKYPVLVFFYGGKWETGTRAQYRFVGKEFARRGFITVIPDYRKYPQVRFPAFVEDAAQAVAWTHDNIAKYGGDVSRLYLSGHSSGAHLAALVTADERYLKNLYQPAGIIKAFAGLAGPYAFTPEENDLKDMFGPPDNYPNMMVTTFIDGHEPPMLLLWGADDTTVGHINLDRLESAIKAKGGQVETKIYPGINHGWIIGALSWLGHNKASVADDVVQFFDKN